MAKERNIDYSRGSRPSFLTRLLSRFFGVCIAIFGLMYRRLLFFENTRDPRAVLRKEGRFYIYALLHGHGLSAILYADDKTATMVSRSEDGDLIAALCKARGVLPVRGSSRKGHVDKGGADALAEMATEIKKRGSAILLMDGPRGPRGVPKRGIAQLAIDTNAVILPLCVVPSRRWILKANWDRFQIPKPFSKVRAIYGKPIDSYGQERDELLVAIAQGIAQLEQEADPSESSAPIGYCKQNTEPQLRGREVLTCMRPPKPAHKHKVRRAVSGDRFNDEMSLYQNYVNQGYPAWVAVAKGRVLSVAVCEWVSEDCFGFNVLTDNGYRCLGYGEAVTRALLSNQMRFGRRPQVVAMSVAGKALAAKLGLFVQSIDK